MIKPLTSLRFFFAFIVFLSHLDWVQTIDASFAPLYEEVLHHGYIGVSFFFILSGFILALNYKEKILHKEISLKDFWVARIARIYPLHLITLLYSIPFFIPELFRQPVLWITTFFSHLFLVQSFVPAEEVYFGFNAISWSIANELFYYLLFPLLIIFLYKFPKSLYLMLLFFLIIPVCIYFTPKIYQIFLYSINPLVRIADFILGILLYKIFELKIFTNWFKKRTHATIVEFSTMLLLILFFSFHNQIPFGYRPAVFYWIPMMCMIYAFAHSAGFFSSILSRRSLVFLGEISFSFYMFHGLLMRTINAIVRRIDFSFNVYAQVLLIFLAIIGVSIISYYYLELPSNKCIRNWYRKRRTEVPVPLLVETENARIKN